MEKSNNRLGLMVLLAAFVVSFAAYTEEAELQTLEAAFPGLTSGALTYASLGELPADVLLKSGNVQITVQELDAQLAKIEANVKGQLEKNKLFLLESISTGTLLLQAAGGQGTAELSPNVAEQELIQKFLEGVVSGVQVTDAEVAKFYEENKEMCGGATLDQIRDQLKDYVLGQKKQDTVTEYVRTLGQRTPILLAGGWVEQQAKLAMDNTVDRARASGKPSLVDFGATGCVPCDMMAPILETLKSKYEGKLNVHFIHVREEEILATRYNIQSIPVQIFFDKDGKEVFRHSGFFAQPEIEQKLAEIGVR